MSLKHYQKKRNFTITPEPPGRIKKLSKIKNLYVVQKHAASHLHYDFRLELNGVLLSWAIPKGPCLDPKIKRLAMHVEDHPVEYGSFEGTIPKGQYGAGTVLLWDKGKWFAVEEDSNAAYKKGSLTFILQAEKLNGRWKLIRINKNDKTWLLIKLNDEYVKPFKNYDITKAKPKSVISNKTIEELSENNTSIWDKNHKQKVKINNPLEKIDLNIQKTSFPKILYPQLATLVDRPPTGKNWLHEIKFDGYRLLIFKKGKQISIFTRNHNDWTMKFPLLVKEISRLPIDNLILDGEIVVLDQDNHANFQLLQNAIKKVGTNFIYYVFDILYYDKYNLLTVPLLKRKNILQHLLKDISDQTIRYSDHILGSGDKVLEKSCELGLEGIISKKIDSIYTQKRDINWLKCKCVKRQEFIIGGYLKSGRRKYFRSLMLGTYDQNGNLNYHGNVGTGFTQESLQSIAKLLSKHISSTIPFANQPPVKDAIWLKPVLVVDVEFTGWTDNLTVRHPSFKGIRNDKLAKDIRIETKKPIESIEKLEKQKININSFYKYLSHPKKILYPEDKITKLEVAEYYHSIQKWILPFIINRPLTFVRCPDNYKKCFFQKHINHITPKGLYSVTIKEKKEEAEYIYLKDKDGLMALTQLGVLEIHPWGSQIKNIERPNMFIFDLDPSPTVPWKKVVEAAKEIKAILFSINLRSFVKTTGGKGLHVVVPIKPEHEWKEIKQFSHLLVDYLVYNDPKIYIGKMSKINRKNKIYIDYLRNQRGATAIAPYSTRALRHAPVATPIEWDELSNDKRDVSFTIQTISERLEKLKSDPWKDFFKIHQSLDLTHFLNKNKNF